MFAGVPRFLTVQPVFTGWAGWRQMRRLGGSVGKRGYGGWVVWIGGKGMITASDILISCLKAKGYSGVCSEDCGCDFDGFCSEVLNCVPAYKHSCCVCKTPCEYKKLGDGCFKPEKQQEG